MALTGRYGVEAAALRRDLIWMLLWEMGSFEYEGSVIDSDGWATSTDVAERWRNGRDRCGLAYVDDYIPRERFTAGLKRLVEEGRAERRKRPRRHPEYRAIEPRL